MRQGVPQGGVLSPTLFNLYMRDVAAVLDGHQAGMKVRQENGVEWRIGGLLYADDIAVITNSAEGMERVLEDVMVCSCGYFVWEMGIELRQLYGEALFCVMRS